MSGTFTGNQDAPYFQSETFGNVLQFIQNHPNDVVLKEKKGKLSLRFDGVRSVKRGILYLSRVFEGSEMISNE
jgi:transcription-repair coupling factor (superfamily II helicase)